MRISRGGLEKIILDEGLSASMVNSVWSGLKSYQKARAKASAEAATEADEPNLEEEELQERTRGIKMKVSKRQLRRIIREEKRLLNETMMEWMEYPDIPDYVLGEVIPQLVNMVDAQVTPLSMSPDDIHDVVTDALQDCMSDIATRLGVKEY